MKEHWMLLSWLDRIVMKVGCHSILFWKQANLLIVSKCWYWIIPMDWLNQIQCKDYNISYMQWQWMMVVSQAQEGNWAIALFCCRRIQLWFLGWVVDIKSVFCTWFICIFIIMSNWYLFQISRVCNWMPPYVKLGLHHVQTFCELDH